MRATPEQVTTRFGDIAVHRYVPRSINDESSEIIYLPQLMSSNDVSSAANQLAIHTGLPVSSVDHLGSLN